MPGGMLPNDAVFRLIAAYSASTRRTMSADCCPGADSTTLGGHLAHHCPPDKHAILPPVHVLIPWDTQAELYDPPIHSWIPYFDVPGCRPVPDGRIHP